MGPWGELVFAACAAIAFGSAVGVVVARKPLRAAVSLLFHIGALAALFLTLHAELLAALQLLVYAGAVVVLFVFVIMLIGPSEGSIDRGSSRLMRVVGATLMVLVTAAVAAALVGVQVARPLTEPDPRFGQFGGVDALGHALFTQALLPFEVVSLLLLVAVVGAIAVAQGRTAAQARELAAQQRRQAQEREARQAAARELSAEVAAHGDHG